jgi:hypothetical protein
MSVGYFILSYVSLYSNDRLPTNFIKDKLVKPFDCTHADQSAVE